MTTAVAKRQHVLRIMGTSGDDEHHFDPDDENERKGMFAMIADLIARGFRIFATKDGRGSLVKSAEDFDPEHDEHVAVGPMAGG